jgi:hypothetical protein
MGGADEVMMTFSAPPFGTTLGEPHGAKMPANTSSRKPGRASQGELPRIAGAKVALDEWTHGRAS